MGASDIREVLFKGQFVFESFLNDGRVHKFLYINSPETQSFKWVHLF